MKSIKVQIFSIKIKEMKENGEIYYLAECDELPSFLVEWDTLGQTVERVDLLLPSFYKEQKALNTLKNMSLLNYSLNIQIKKEPNYLQLH